MATIEQLRQHDGTTTYRAKIPIKGYPPQTATFQRLTDARRWVQSTEAEIRERRTWSAAIRTSLNRIQTRSLPR
jgi:hypothetical protein